MNLPKSHLEFKIPKERIPLVMIDLAIAAAAVSQVAIELACDILAKVDPSTPEEQIQARVVEKIHRAFQDMETQVIAKHGQ